MGAFFAIPLVRKIGVGVIIVAAVGGFFGYQLHKAKQAGKEEGKQESAQQVKSDSEKALNQERNDFLQKLNAANTTLQKYDDDLKASHGREQALQDVLLKINKQKDAASDKLDKTPDSQLHSTIVEALGLRDPGNQSPGYLPIEERGIAKCLTVDRPSCEANYQAQSGDIAELRGQIANLNGQVTEWNKKFDDLGVYANQVQQAYVQIYNAFPKKGNTLLALVTLGHKGRPKKLPFPDPQELLGKKKESK